jgi:hypothetical protein
MQTNATDSTIGHDASYNQITGVQVRGCEVAFVEWGSNTDNTYIGCSAENVTAKFRSWGSTQVLDASPVGLKPSSTQVEFEQRTVVKTWGVDPGLTGWNRFYLVQEQEDGKLSPCTRTAIPIGFLHSIPNRSGDPAFISLLTPGRAFTGIAGHTLAVGWVGCDDNGKLENKTSGFAVGRVDQIWELDEKVKVACMPTFIP